MTRKDYILIANVINEYDFDDLGAQLSMAQAFADKLGQENASFNRAKFIETCMERKGR